MDPEGRSAGGTAGAGAGTESVTLSALVDMRDPPRAVRVLSTHAEALRQRLETLRMERENLHFQIRLLKQDGQEAQPDQLQEQVARLELENRSAAAVESEAQQLQKRLAEVERQAAALPPREPATAASPPPPPPAPPPSDANDETLAELRWENRLLEKKVRSMAMYVDQQHTGMLRARLTSSAGSRASSRPGTARSAASAGGGLCAGGLAAVAEALSVTGENNDLDAKVAQVLEGNESMLRKLRDEMRDTATAIARRGTADRSAGAGVGAAGPAKPPARSGNRVDVLTIGAGQGGRDVEWHKAR